MKFLPVVSILVAILALAGSTAALVAGSGGGDDPAGEIAELNRSISALEGSLAALKEDVASISKGSGDASMALSSLRERVEKTEAAAVQAKEALADLPEAPAVAGVEPEKLQEIVREQVRAAREEREREQQERWRQGMIDRAKRDYGVDDEKAAKVADIQRKTWEKMGPLWREYRNDREGMQKAAKELWDNAEKEMATFLTEEQLAKVKEQRRRIEERMGGGRGRGGDRRRPEPAPAPADQKPDEPAVF